MAGRCWAFLLVGHPLQEHRTQDVDGGFRSRERRTVERQLALQDEIVHGAHGGAAILTGPCRRQPSLGRQIPAELSCVRPTLVGGNVADKRFRRAEAVGIVLGEPSSNLGSQRFMFVGEGEVHVPYSVASRRSATFSR
jgi:hypothetical protein